MGIRVGRSLRWERGLKYRFGDGRNTEVKSLPSVGAWVEIILDHVDEEDRVKSLPSVGAWVEIIQVICDYLKCGKSLPSVGAWVEISNITGTSGQGCCRSLRWERGLKYFVFLL